MASLSRDGKGWRILFWDSDGKRKTIRLPRGLDKKGAQALKLRVETIIAAKLAGTPLPQDLALWLREISNELHDRLVRTALVPPRENRFTVKDLVDLWLHEAEKSQAKPSTLVAMRVGAAKLVELLGDRPAAMITVEDALRYRDQLLASGLRPATVSRRIQHARHIFREAQRRGLITKNPFEVVRPPKHNPADRRRYVTVQETQLLIEAAPNSSWRLLIALARYAGLRIPSEALSLRWEDVLWADNRLVIRSPKTERTGKPYRVIPMFPLVKPYLEQAFELAEEGDVFVFPQLWRQRAQGATGWVNCNFRTQFERIIRHAGLEPWPRLWHNLRASCESDLAQSFPLAVVTKWLGNTPSIALRHYVDPTDIAFEQAVHWHPEGPKRTANMATPLEKRPNALERSIHQENAEAGRQIPTTTPEVIPSLHNEASLPTHLPFRQAANAQPRAAIEKTIPMETAGLSKTLQEKTFRPRPQKTLEREEMLSRDLVSQCVGELATEKAIPTDNPALRGKYTERRPHAHTPQKGGGSESGSTVAPETAPQSTARERIAEKTTPEVPANIELMRQLALDALPLPNHPMGDDGFEPPTSTL
ncbi:site-specific integrase [Thermopirellula anaerolimosa]